MEKFKFLLIGMLVFFTFSGTRAQEQDSNFFEGTWDVFAEATPMGDLTMKLSIYQDNGKLKGYITSPASPEASELSKIAVQNDILTLNWVAAGGYSLELVLAKMEGDDLTGKLMGMFEATAKKTSGNAEIPVVKEAELKDIVTEIWNAKWISFPEENTSAYGVYLFRKQVELSKVPQKFPVHVSADNRYKLYVNEKLVSLGPARGDLTHWNYETIDIAPFLKAGRNSIAAKVWNMGTSSPEAQISLQTAFILQGDSQEAQY